jgi:hypothetical protein
MGEGLYFSGAAFLSCVTRGRDGISMPGAGDHQQFHSTTQDAGSDYRAPEYKSYEFCEFHDGPQSSSLTQNTSR